jgi:large subunit ribosomal protein L10
VQPALWAVQQAAVRLVNAPETSGAECGAKGGGFSLALTRERKEELVAEYVDLLKDSKAIIFTEYRGMSNPEMTTLRRAVRDADGVYRVTKLTLLELAMEEAGYPRPDILSGAPLAVGFCLEEIPGVAKALTEFADEQTENLVVRGGLIGADFISAAEIEALAELPPLDVLRSQLIGLLDAPASQLVGVIQAGVAQVVNVLNAYVEQGEGGETAEAAA